MKKTAYWILAVLGLLAAPNLGTAEPLKVVLVSGSELYKSEVSLPPFKEYLEKHFEVQVTLVQAADKQNMPGLEALEDCDVALFFTRRLEISGEQIERVKEYALGGKAIVAVRTASHGFQNFLEFDKVILGDNYDGHYNSGVLTKVTVAPGQEQNPILAGVGVLDSTSSLYKTAPLEKDTTLILAGTAPKGTQPLAWTREVNGGRVFYTSLGAVDDFKNPSFSRMISNALFWTARGEVPEPR